MCNMLHKKDLPGFHSKQELAGKEWKQKVTLSVTNRWMKTKFGRVNHDFLDVNVYTKEQNVDIYTITCIQKYKI